MAPLVLQHSNSWLRVSTFRPGRQRPSLVRLLAITEPFTPLLFLLSGRSPGKRHRGPDLRAGRCRGLPPKGSTRGIPAAHAGIPDLGEGRTRGNPPKSRREAPAGQAPPLKVSSSSSPASASWGVQNRPPHSDRPPPGWPGPAADSGGGVHVSGGWGAAGPVVDLHRRGSARRSHPPSSTAPPSPDRPHAGR